MSVSKHLSANHCCSGSARESGYRIAWRGNTFPMVYADVSLQLADDMTS
jgi:hypothetical protein